MDDRLLLGDWHLQLSPAPPAVERRTGVPADPPPWVFELPPVADVAGDEGRRRAAGEHLTLLADEFERTVHEFLGTPARSGGRGRRWASQLAARFSTPSAARGCRLRAWLVHRLSTPERSDILELLGKSFTGLLESEAPVVESVRSGRGGAVVFVIELHRTDESGGLVLPPVVRQPIDIGRLQNQMRRALLQAGLTLQAAGERMGYKKGSARVSMQSLLTSPNPGIVLVDKLAGVCDMSLVELLQLPADPVTETRQKLAARNRS